MLRWWPSFNSCKLTTHTNTGLHFSHTNSPVCDKFNPPSVLVEGQSVHLSLSRISTETTDNAHTQSYKLSFSPSLSVNGKDDGGPPDVQHLIWSRCEIKTVLTHSKTTKPSFTEKKGRRRDKRGWCMTVEYFHSTFVLNVLLPLIIFNMHSCGCWLMVFMVDGCAF